MNEIESIVKYNFINILDQVIVSVKCSYLCIEVSDGFRRVGLNNKEKQ